MIINMVAFDVLHKFIAKQEIKDQENLKDRISELDIKQVSDIVGGTIELNKDYFQTISIVIFKY